MKHSEVNWPRLVDFLARQVGKPYVFGVENPPGEEDWDKYKAWDCSELVEVGFHKIGLVLPDGAYNQAKVVTRLEMGPPPKIDVLLIGDLGFKWNPENQTVHHVGVYVGEGKVVEAKGKDFGVVSTAVADYMSSSHFAFWGRHKNVEDA